MWLSDGVSLHAPLVISQLLHPYPDFSIAVVEALQCSQRHLGHREALSKPSPTPRVLPGPQGYGMQLLLWYCQGRDRIVSRVRLKEGPCSTAQKGE